ncbi:C39 family peptidase [Fontivita pretiosa]|uniref:C39 family peptidase n=1 Tax=Fontivita pretiosa TaxID=2989684 RepID=UPI003D18070E
MSWRGLIILYSATAAIVIAILAIAILVPAPSGGNRDASTGNVLVGRPNMVDRLIMFDSVERFLAGELEHVAVIHDDPALVVLDDRRLKTYPRYGSWTSPVIQTEFAFTELIPSWNVHAPANTGVRFQVRTRDARSGQWSPWLYVGQWGRTSAARRIDRPLTHFQHGVVHTDTLLLDRAADALQVRASLQSFDLDRTINPSVRRVAVSYSGQVNDDGVRAMLIESLPVRGNWAKDLKVPFRAQGDSPPALRSQICSATATTMVMAWWGVDRPTVENALAIYDESADIFGNWSRAVARAGELGLDAWITRFRNWEQVKAMIQMNQPIIAAIRFKRGEFPSSVLKQSDGHLVVIRGLLPSGDVICNDPASRDKGNGVIYKAEELGRAWFTNAGGVGYVIRRSRAGGADTLARP